MCCQRRWFSQVHYDYYYVASNAAQTTANKMFDKLRPLCEHDPAKVNYASVIHKKKQLNARIFPAPNVACVSCLSTCNRKATCVALRYIDHFIQVSHSVKIYYCHQYYSQKKTVWKLPTFYFFWRQPVNLQVQTKTEILIIVGTNIPDITGHQMTVQLFPPHPASAAALPGETEEAKYYTNAHWRTTSPNTN